MVNFLITAVRSTFYRIASQYFDVSSLHLSLTMTGQSIVKHILTEGDKIILSWYSPLQDQGGYAVAVNYGEHRSRLGCFRYSDDPTFVQVL